MVGIIKRRDAMIRRDTSSSCWQAKEAKTKFSQLLQDAQKKDQIITLRDQPIAVLVSKNRYDQLVRKESLLEFFQKAPLPEVDIAITRNIELTKDSISKSLHPFTISQEKTLLP
jgi:prevent-host-death family protein